MLSDRIYYAMTILFCNLFKNNGDFRTKYFGIFSSLQIFLQSISLAQQPSTAPVISENPTGFLVLIKERGGIAPRKSWAQTLATNGVQESRFFAERQKKAKLKR